MGEGQTGIGAREGRVEAQRHLEKMPRLLVVGLVETVHVPEAAVIAPPRRRASSAASGWRGCARPSRSRWRSRRRCCCRSRRARRRRRRACWSNTSAQTMRAVRVSMSSTATVSRLARAAHRPAHDIIDVKQPARLFGADAPLAQRKHCALRDDEQAPELSEPGDHIVGEGVARAAANARRAGAVEERHHGDRSAPGRWGDGFLLLSAAVGLGDCRLRAPLRTDRGGFVAAVGNLRHEAEALAGQGPDQPLLLPAIADRLPCRVDAARQRRTPIRSFRPRRLPGGRSCSPRARDCE